MKSDQLIFCSGNLYPYLIRFSPFITQAFGTIEDWLDIPANIKEKNSMNISIWFKTLALEKYPNHLNGPLLPCNWRNMSPATNIFVPPG